jgi:RNA recognition motif-containing protein
MNIYVGNLPYGINDESLKAMFTEFGEVDTAKVIMDRQSGQSKGFGFVEMPSNSDADKAIKALNGKMMNNRNLKVNQATPNGKAAPPKKRRF